MTNAAQNLDPEVHPLRAAIQTAEAIREEVQATVAALGEDETIGADDPRWVAACDADAAAEAALDMAREAIEGSDCPRLWDMSEDGNVFGSTIATSAKAALREARSGVERGNYSDEIEGTIWIDVRVHCRETDESASGTVQLDEDEPDCDSDEAAHDWQSPYALLGGIKENPGVWCHGGGVIITEVCIRCGCKKVTDTWAQRPDTGEQGLTSVSYEEGAFTADELTKAIE